ncbi:MAG TPA: DegT/DnrJ/EryC1/StrS aminotransferase family protein [Blattabacteriaceae bacterium]|nr:DegT/DnrJ/EryC1/StrS aminotransferase family protein [Blattabacteriaceae bacterium]
MNNTGIKEKTETRVLPGWPHFAADEVQAATRVLESGKINYWTGDEGRRFEAEFAEFAGCKYGVALANGTVALELALLAADTRREPQIEQMRGQEQNQEHPQPRAAVPHEDGVAEVVTTSRTFIASASCAVMRGMKPVMADVDRESQNVTAETIREAITPRTKAIIAVHLAGWPCDMDPIMELAREHNLLVVEDCAQAHGATYKGKPVGSMGHVAAFSFCQDKIMTTGGEGGMLVTNNEAIWERAWAFKDHGKSYDAVYRREHAPGFRWLHEQFGTNWRLTEMQSALGRVQLRKLPGWVKIRQRNAEMLTQEFGRLEALRLTPTPADVEHSYYKYYAFVRPERLKQGWSRDRIMAEINERGVPCFSGSCSEIYLEKAFTGDMQPSRRLPVAKELGETSLMWLVHPTLKEDDVRWMAKVSGEVMAKASR